MTETETWIGALRVGEGLQGWRLSPSGDILQSAWAEDATSLAGLIQQLGSHPMVVCGLIGETRSVPCAPLPANLPDTGGACIVPGLQDVQFGVTSDGAEAAIAGFLSTHDGWDGVICVAGADSHVWAHVSAGEVVSFQRFASPRLAAALTPSGRGDADFDTAFATVMSRPERLAAQLASAASAEALWGALIGAELAAARAYWLGQQLAVIGDGPGADGVERALAGQGVPVTRADLVPMVIAGLNAARRRVP